MKIAAVEMREVRLPLVHFFETSFGRTYERRILLVRVRDEAGATGWGECTAGEGPFYCEEWTESAWAVSKTFLAPQLVRQEFAAPSDVSAHMRRVRGNRRARPAVEPAGGAWAARRGGVPRGQRRGAPPAPSAAK